MNRKTSIVVLTYNHERFIVQNLEGIFMQKVDFPIQLIICDDCSSDRTDDVIRKFLKENFNPNIQVNYFRHSKNMGATPNFYWALKQVKGKYLALCEGDDFWTDDDKLQKQYNFMEENSDYAICFHSVDQVDENNLIIADKQFSSIQDRDYNPTEIYQNWQLHTTSVFMKSEVLDNDAVKKTLLSHPNLLYFDTPLYMAASLTGKMRGDSTHMSAYRRHTAGISFGKNLKRDLKHNVYDRIIGKYYGGKIRDISKWLIFKRSKDNMVESIKMGKFTLAIQYFFWMLSEYKKMGIYYINKIK